MSKIRRFKVEALADAGPGSEVSLSVAESRHVRVLRLKPGTLVELFDGLGWVSRGELLEDERSVALVDSPKKEESGDGCGGKRVSVFVSWPKGKRAAFLVEKCSELGVTEIVPLRCERTVVSKRSDSQGVVRLQRIANEAAKQAGRNDSPVIGDELKWEDIFKSRQEGDVYLMLAPKAEKTIYQILDDVASSAAVPVCTRIVLLIGPEGGFTEKEGDWALEMGAIGSRLASNVLRVETAAIAACAVIGAAILDS